MIRDSKSAVSRRHMDITLKAWFLSLVHTRDKVFKSFYYVIMHVAYPCCDARSIILKSTFSRHRIV